MSGKFSVWMWYFFHQLIVPSLPLNFLSSPSLTSCYPSLIYLTFYSTSTTFLFSLNSGNMKTSLSIDHKPCQSLHLGLQSWPAWRRNCMLSVRLRLRLGLFRWVWRLAISTIICQVTNDVHCICVCLWLLSQGSIIQSLFTFILIF